MTKDIEDQEDYILKLNVKMPDDEDLKESLSRAVTESDDFMDYKDKMWFSFAETIADPIMKGIFDYNYARKSANYVLDVDDICDLAHSLILDYQSAVIYRSLFKHHPMLMSAIRNASFPAVRETLDEIMLERWESVKLYETDIFHAYDETANEITLSIPFATEAEALAFKLAHG